ncbi:monosaccharide ABC transporter substrate-binding protein, CUT2 family [Chthonomonas calidirosea]|uniref:Monosaccharide ABC transporter substrate-binding protein, CUT2 family (TC 3.A.1.2.-) n=1 Tax=Chthonomonas calidirosea (strain DSM 23976 / ICMP 18418 / T49) TaxID=1303518 RepID=S0EVT7_CHTCT|nr:substrate-binding domain-containing protein [Chthonomonas calidirosea]CCW35557.1 monosaccharide ABC transporter substrate-binding protein, CUT2 family (TC 3.A.1.2.-) [Chthonomonas calidirosea T49]CEK18915.1 monosaccharide ABC transporter substrate-binding protein, CUT2 family [Chthonomonas calidirosea]CEK19918.1 monosaccharide ABC transporter substrate-binding protein, CUT2 family [Chthonomonas calidirosea]
MTRSPVRFFQAIALFMFAIGLAGCRNPAAAPHTSEATSGSSPSASAHYTLNLPEPPEPAIAIPSSPAKRPYRIAVSLLTRDDDFYITLEKGLREEAAKEGVQLTVESGDKDLNKQINQVQNFVAQKYDAIILCPVDSQGVISAVTLANNAHIPVFTADITSNGGKIVSYIASDNVQGGRLVGEYAAKNLLHGKGEVAILDLSTVTSVQDRVRGFKQAIAQYPGIRIVADQDVPGAKRENALPVATDILTAHPHINLIFGINDPVALGALSALQQLNNKAVMVVGFDAGPEAQNYIASGSQLKAEAIQYPHLIGKTAIDAVVKVLNGGTVPPKIAIPTGLVTQASFIKK